ncbi:hypothetical protein PV08_08941 [Exophiala spinifera]|uniref:EthD domain-containing protein n=1 Tax=Exophiala spinifera TaxID=91928 RepID=A0A0D2B4X0_9EURO|nr:uncharacterized protein PV08_08941 [Exophiala spinifera]KIW13750.1 hypothetical protein PV08_08941 [Exophiala spinifera]
MIPGLMMVPMALQPDLSAQDCDDWYNNEHVPMRMRLPFFETGYRYRSTEQHEALTGTTTRQPPEWLALYEVNDMKQLKEPTYERLLNPDVQSWRERVVMQKISASRRYYDFVASHGRQDSSTGGVKLEDSQNLGDAASAYAETLVVVRVRLRSDLPAAEAEKEWDRWYVEDHLPPLCKVPGWQRTRRYRTSVIDDQPSEAPAVGCSAIEYLTLNEFAHDAAIGGPEHQIAIQTEWLTDVVESKWRQSYKLHYIQSKAPRDLSALYRSAADEFVSPDGMTRTLSGLRPRVESYIATRDNNVVPYRLEGCGTDTSPIIVMCVSIFGTWISIDDVADTFLSREVFRKGRVLQLTLPCRVRNEKNALAQFPDVEDLEDCFSALMIPKCSLLISLDVRGMTAEGNQPREIQHISAEDSHYGIGKLCDNALLLVARSKKATAKMVADLVSAVSEADNVDGVLESVLKELTTTP